MPTPKFPTRLIKLLFATPQNFPLPNCVFITFLQLYLRSTHPSNLPAITRHLKVVLRGTNQVGMLQIYISPITLDLNHKTMLSNSKGTLQTSEIDLGNGN